jgi:hypothetical protein
MSTEMDETAFKIGLDTTLIRTLLVLVIRGTSYFVHYYYNHISFQSITYYNKSYTFFWDMVQWLPSARSIFWPYVVFARVDLVNY